MAALVVPVYETKKVSILMKFLDLGERGIDFLAHEMASQLESGGFGIEQYVMFCQLNHKHER